MTIRIRILIPMIILTIVASVTVLVSNIGQFSHYVEADMNNYLQTASRAAFEQIETRKVYALTVSMFIAECSVIREALVYGDYTSNESREKVLAHVLQHVDTHLSNTNKKSHSGSRIDFCTITDASGNVILRTHASASYGDNVSHIPSIKAALRGNSTSDIEAGSVARMTIGAGTPIYDEQGNLVGAVATGFRMDSSAFVDSIAEIFDCVVTIYMADERIATTMRLEDGTRAIGTQIPKEVSKVILTGNAFTGRLPLFGREALTRYTPMWDKTYRLVGVLAIAGYLDNVTATIQSFVYMGLSFSVLIIVFSIPIMIFISRRIAAPINEASEALSEIAGGDFDVRVTGHYKGDLAVLQHAVNDTAAKLSVYLKEKLQEDKIRELAAIVSIADAGIVMKDKNGAIRQWNIGAVNILGYEPEEMIGNTTHMYVPEESHKSVDEIDARVAKGEHIAQVEVVRKHKKGHLVDCSASYTPIIDNEGHFSGSVIIFHDISDKKAAEQEIKRFAAIFSMADAGILIRDKDGLITNWNVGAQHILGYTPEEMIGKTTQILTPKSDYALIDSFNERLKAGKHIRHSQDIKIHKDGHPVHCSASVTPLLDDAGHFTGSVVIFHDITKEKEAEEKARSLAAIVANADAGVIVKNSDGVVREWNVGAENILGYTPEEMIGRTTHYYAPEESHAEINANEARLAKGEHIAHAEVVRKHKDGYWVDCSASYTPILDNAGHFAGSVAIFHDITDKKRIEAALKEALLDTEKKNLTIMASIDYAGKIQRSLLPKECLFEKVFLDYAVIWCPRDTVGGDIYWLKKFDKGAVLCLCDCTGHGTPGALLTMMVASAFEDTVNENNYTDTAHIIWMLEQRLVNAFGVHTDIPKSHLSEVRDGCDLAVLYIAADGSVTVASGNIHVFVCDGQIVRRIKGQRLYIGEGSLKSMEDVKTVTIPFQPEYKFYMASDGLFDQIGGATLRPFGYKTFKQIILENHQEKQAVITKRIREAFEAFQGEQQRRDDVALITFKPRRMETL